MDIIFSTSRFEFERKLANDVLTLAPRVFDDESTEETARKIIYYLLQPEVQVYQRILCAFTSAATAIQVERDLRAKGFSEDIIFLTIIQDKK